MLFTLLNFKLWLETVSNEYFPTVGTEFVKATCVRADDESMVSDHFCGGERPSDETIKCNTYECPAR